MTCCAGCGTRAGSSSTWTGRSRLATGSTTGFARCPARSRCCDWVRDRGLPYVVFTNGTNRTPGAFRPGAARRGPDVPDDRMMTPASSAVVMFTRRGYKRVMVLGGDGHDSAAARGGHRGGAAGRGRTGHPPVAGARRGGRGVRRLVPRVHHVPRWRPRARRSGAGRRCTARRRRRSSPSAGGRALGTSRAISAMIRSVTGCRLTVTGKPSLDALRAAAAAARRPGQGPRRGRRRPAARGADGAPRPRARRRGPAPGSARPDAYDHLPPRAQPHLHLRGIDELLALCREQS